jgi:NAD(P)-dependent dehydrogenase (short-subunit alcohol dehydrogenase family)
MDQLPAILKQFNLTGRTALITGGSQGLGKVIAETLASVGAKVIIVSRRLDACQAVANEIASSTGSAAFAFSADVSKGDQVESLFHAVSKEVGPVDILINSAGINIRGPIASLSVADWDAVIDANLKAPFLMARQFGPAMAERKWGRVIHFGSILSAVGIAGRTPYASSKAGLLGLTRTLALEWATSGVTVNSLCPGVFGTEMNRPLMDDPKRFAEFVSKIPFGRWGELEEICAPALFLASNASSYMTGQVLFVDGGWTAQ